jgi:hypothetical protein
MKPPLRPEHHLQQKSMSNLAQSITLLNSIWEIPSLNLGKTTENADRHLSQLSSVPPGECRVNALNGPRPLLYPFQFNIH